MSLPLIETAKLYILTLCVRQINVNVIQGSQVQIFYLSDVVSVMACTNDVGTAKQYFLTLCVRQINVNVTQGFQVQIFYLPDVVIGMACVNDGDCQAVNTVCTSNHCKCDTGFSGPDLLSFRCCHWDGMCQ